MLRILALLLIPFTVFAADAPIDLPIVSVNYGNWSKNLQWAANSSLLDYVSKNNYKDYEFAVQRVLTNLMEENVYKSNSSGISILSKVANNRLFVRQSPCTEKNTGDCLLVYSGEKMEPLLNFSDSSKLSFSKIWNFWVDSQGKKIILLVSRQLQGFPLETRIISYSLENLGVPKVLREFIGGESFPEEAYFNAEATEALFFFTGDEYRKQSFMRLHLESGLARSYDLPDASLYSELALNYSYSSNLEWVVLYKDSSAYYVKNLVTQKTIPLENWDPKQKIQFHSQGFFYRKRNSQEIFFQSFVGGAPQAISQIKSESFVVLENGLLLGANDKEIITLDIMSGRVNSIAELSRPESSFVYDAKSRSVYALVKKWSLFRTRHMLAKLGLFGAPSEYFYEVPENMLLGSEGSLSPDHKFLLGFTNYNKYNGTTGSIYKALISLISKE